jgi:predicted dithiol-disulfide oxidoreductase (DUF899 family)
MSLPAVVTGPEWSAARDILLAKEKQATRALDALAAERRRLPMVRIAKEDEFAGPDGPAPLLDLFGGRRQLIVSTSCSGPAPNLARAARRSPTTSDI